VEAREEVAAADTKAAGCLEDSVEAATEQSAAIPENDMFCFLYMGQKKFKP